MTAPVPIPLKHACWIWPEGGELYLNNCHAQFRHDFELETVPGNAPFFITADQQYRLSVNGRYVCRGPARGYQESWPFDEVDLSSFLKTGHNWIAIEAYNPGTGTFQYIHRNAAGMICAAEWGNTRIRSCKAEWKMRRSPANNPNVARQSRQLGYQEDFDANLDDLSWVYSELPPQWEEKEMFRWFGESAFGLAPWYEVEARGIPMLREECVAPEKIVSWGTGRMRPGFERAFHLAWHWEEGERQTVSDWHESENYPCRKKGDFLEFEVSGQPAGTFLALTIKLDSIRTGTFGLEVAGGTGSEIADALFYQYLPEDKPVDLPPIGYGGMIAPAARLRIAPEFCRRMFYSIQGARHIVLVLRNVSQRLHIRALWRTAEYPFAMRGMFMTSDRELDAIYELCRHTQQICSSDAYMDTPWREQGQWWGDARIQARNTFFLDGDPRLLRRGIRSIAGQKTRSGLTPGVAPCCNEQCVLPDFSLTWILTLFDDYWQTGDLSLFLEQQSKVDEILRYFHTPETRGENGLLKADPRFWLFEDWADLPKRGYPTFLNLWYLYTLHACEHLCRAAAKTKKAEELAHEQLQLKNRISHLLFDEKLQLFRSGLENDYSPCPEPPTLHDQVLAVLNGLHPEAHPVMIRERLLPFLRNESCQFATPSSFWCSYLFDAAKKLGLRKETLSFLRRNWSRMIPSGGTWEHFHWNRYDGQSCCHAWSAHPASHLPELLTGIHQLEPGWRRFSCSPDPDLLPESGEIRIPLPQGIFRMTWNTCSEISLEVPDGCLCETSSGIIRNQSVLHKIQEEQ